MKDWNNVTAHVDYVEATVSPSQAEEHAFGTAKLLGPTSEWSKQAIGATALVAIASIWGLSALFEP